MNLKPIHTKKDLQWAVARIQMGLKQNDVAQYFGGKNRVSEVLSRKRPLSLRMIRNLHRHFHIPSDTLIKVVS